MSATTVERNVEERADEVGQRGRRLWGRPELYTSYRLDVAMLNTRPKQIGALLLIVVAYALPWTLDDPQLNVLVYGLVASIGAIGLNLVTGYAGQVSLGHAFFLGVGAYTAAVIGGDPSDPRLHGFGITAFPVWLLAAGTVAAICGAIVAPLAVRLRGLYLAIVTLGLVFLGEHIFREWDTVTGGPGVGRRTAPAELFGYRFDAATATFTKQQNFYLLALTLLIIFAVLARNIARSDVGRAFSAVRDRDIAAEVIGVNLTKQKVLAFTISSFYAGVAGALLYSFLGVAEPGSFGLLLSVQYIAMILIGGVATISGSIMGAIFISSLGYLTRRYADDIPGVDVLTSGGLDNAQVEAILYGLLIIVFLLFESRGLYGIWIRTRNYWKGWPFSY